MNGTPVRIFDERLEHLFGLRTPLLKALKAAGDTHTVQDVADCILRGVFKYWPAAGGAAVTEILTYPRKRACHIFLAFGDLDAVLSVQPQIEAFALANGCTALSACGRHGWDKVLPKRGWDRRWTVHTKALT